MKESLGSRSSESDPTTNSSSTTMVDTGEDPLSQLELNLDMDTVDSHTLTMSESETNPDQGPGPGLGGPIAKVQSICPDDLLSLLQLFTKTTYRAKDSQPKITGIMDKCLSLFGLDYKYSILTNTSGELSTNYPSKLIILESEKALSPSSQLAFCPLSSSSSSCSCSTHQKNGKETTPITSIPRQLYHPTNSYNGTGTETGGTPNPIDPVKLKELCSRARLARCRARFPVPVILYNKKHICRSATLSGGPEIYGRSSFDYFFSTGGGFDDSGGAGDDDDFTESSESGNNGSSNQSDWQLFDRVRSQDIRLLKTFNVQTIVDLMVEKKKVKFGVNVTSSEKVDKENRYADFNIVSLPYPGCEFFKEFRDNGYRAEELIFQWNQGHVDAHLCVPPTTQGPAASLDCNWSHYRNWDLVLLSQNYLKLLLAYLSEGCGGGLLIHCISGWDRTPLFISLLRLSLWADGAIHKTLDSDQILYLTLAYDWLLFGHNLEDRLSKGEEILSFCFHFLKYIVGPDFSVINHHVQSNKSTTSQNVLSRVRNDSDCHLEGSLLLLDGGEGTGANGSNWSLNSSGSSSAVSVGSEAGIGTLAPTTPLPPSSFQIDGDSSWEDYSSVQNPNNSVQQFTTIPTTASASAYPQIDTSCILTASMIQDTTPTLVPTPAYSISQPSTQSQPQPSNSFNGRMKGCLGTTSTRPIAVNSLNWQLITGPGSLRESLSCISSSDPSSSNTTSRPLRTTGGAAGPLGLDYGFDSSESSCTLVDELDLTPIDTQPALLLLESCLGLGDTGRSLLNSESETELALGLALLEESGGGGGSSSTDTTTPTKEDFPIPLPQEEEIVTCYTNNNDESPSITRRRERLEKVRSRFSSLYQQTVGRAWSMEMESNGTSSASANNTSNPTTPKPQESQTSSTSSAATGLGFFIGNFANRVVGNMRHNNTNHTNRIVNP